MDLLTLAKLIHRRAKEKQAKGEIPTFLGVQGMLALMHKNICDYYNNVTEETAGDYVLDLCVNSIFALQCVVPDIVDDSRVEDRASEEDAEQGSNEDVEDDAGGIQEIPQETESDRRRFTPIKPGQSISDITTRE